MDGAARGAGGRNKPSRLKPVTRRAAARWRSTASHCRAGAARRGRNRNRSAFTSIDAPATVALVCASYLSLEPDPPCRFR